MFGRAFIFTSAFVVLVSACATSKVADTRRPAGFTDGVNIVVKNGDTASFTPQPDSENSALDAKTFDVVVMGGGLAGLTSALYLTDAGKTVLLLEKEAEVGGIASYGQDGDSKYGRGAAYWTDPYEEEDALLKRIHLGSYRKDNPIPEPVDSYYVRGQYFKGIWDKETLKRLPSSFALFKFELQRLIDANTVPNQPIEEAVKYGKSLELDKINSQQWVESMPGELEKFLSAHRNSKNYAEGKQIFERYQQEFANNPKGMQGVVELMDLYCRSALGGNSVDVSAVALANFYESEIVTRYTSDEGNGIAAQNIFKELLTRPKLFTYRTNAAVTNVKSDDNGVQVRYNLNGQSHQAQGHYSVFSMQLKLAPTLIEDFRAKAPQQAKVIDSIGFTHYSVHSVHVEGQPYRSAYDTWTRANDYTDDDFSDVILGHWMNPKMRGYIGYRDFKHDPPIPDGVFTIYHPLPPKWVKTDYSDDDARAIAKRATERLGELYTQLPSDVWQGPFKVTSIETNRWPLAIHTAGPGFFSKMVRVMRRPFGRVYFAHSNLGTPAIEEALFRGHCAADNILKKINPEFALEKWTRCPLEK